MLSLPADRKWHGTCLLVFVVMDGVVPSIYRRAYMPYACPTAYALAFLVTYYPIVTAASSLVPLALPDVCLCYGDLHLHSRTNHGAWGPCSRCLQKVSGMTHVSVLLW